MTTARAASVACLVVAVVVGSLADRPPLHPPVFLGGYRVIAADFHTHSSMWSDGSLTPWGLVLEAERQGLDAIAITGHNEVSDSVMGRWFSGLVGGPTVLTGEEIIAPSHHVIALGITHTVSWREPVAREVDAIHDQGGVAIAAHPGQDTASGYDTDALRHLDGAEICHPMIYALDDAQQDLERFAARASLAAIGSSDFHGVGPMGRCRTYVFATDNTAPAILDALRQHRTVVYGLGGKAYGDPTLIALAERNARLLAPPSIERHGWWDRVGQITSLLGLFGLILIGDIAREKVLPKAAGRGAWDDRPRLLVRCGRSERIEPRRIAQVAAGHDVAER